MENEKEEKKYAGKFETVEALEEGYKHASRVFQENENLKKQLEDFKTPDAYLKPENAELNDQQIERLEKIARNSNLTQSQFEKLIWEREAEIKNKLANRETKIKSLGEEKINILKDYIDKNFADYTDEAKGTLLENFIMNDQARESALKHRDKTLNTSIPGMSSIAPANYTVTQDDVYKAREASEKKPSDKHLREKYLNLLKAQSAQKQKS